MSGGRVQSAPARPAAAPAWLRRGLGAVAALLALGVLALGAVGWEGSQRALHPAPSQPEHSLAEYAFSVEEVRFPSRDGTPLNGWLVKGARPETIIVVHGFRDSKQSMLEYVDLLYRAGFSVLALDLRSSPTGGAAATTFGYFERRDVAAAADYLLSRADVDGQRIGALGVSMGAASALMGAADSEAIRAVVAEGSYKSLDSVVAVGFEHFLGLPAFPFAPVTVRVAEWRAGIAAAEIRPIDAVPRLAPRPLLFIVGLESTEVPVQDSIDLFRAARGPRQLWLIPGAGHGDGLKKAPREYAARVSAFFDAALNGRPLPSLGFAVDAR